jgi:hypothetical protein
MVNDIYSKGSITADEQFAPFSRYIDVNGLRMFVLDKVKDEFVLDIVYHIYFFYLPDNY